MPVRIYDISKKLGLENKQVLSKAKELSITAAKVPSSSLDKITAEYLEEELLKAHPEAVARLATPPAPEKPKVAPVEQKIEIITAPPPPPPVIEPPAPEIAEAAPLVAETKAEAAPAPVVPTKPPEPPKPKVGEKVGFILQSEG